MKLSIYEHFPGCAKEIREEVFVKEQGFEDEFDEIDASAVHIVLFTEDGVPAAVCRVFWSAGMECHVLGRLAVRKEYRGREMGSAVVREAERYVRENGGKGLALHAQCTAAAFYRKLGFAEFGSVEDDQGCPHIWMKKSL